MIDVEYTSDYDEQTDAVRLGLLEYDDTHCKHGTFTGNWAGPDYMCGPCEMGISDEDWLAGKRRADLRARRVRALRPKLGALILALNASSAIDPNSPESQRLFKRLGRYIHWRVQPPHDIEQMAREAKEARA